MQASEWVSVRACMLACVCVCVFLLSTQLFVFPLKHHPSLFNLAAEYSDLIMWADIRISQALLPSTEGSTPKHTPILTLHMASRSTHTEGRHALVPPEIMCLSQRYLLYSEPKAGDLLSIPRSCMIHAVMRTHTSLVTVSGYYIFDIFRKSHLILKPE